MIVVEEDEHEADDQDVVPPPHFLDFAAAPLDETSLEFEQQIQVQKLIQRVLL